jgi:hypothetical protein
MPKKIANVKCPWCKLPFQIEIRDKYNKYKNAQAIPQGGNLTEGEPGHNQACPNRECERQLFIRYLS